jgi:MFS family permease
MLTLGAALGGLVVKLFGVQAAFLINSVSYLVAAGLIASISLPLRPPRAKQKFTWARALGVTDWLEGWRYVWARPRLLAYLLVKPVWGVMGGMLALLAIFGEKIFPVAGSAALGIGVLYTARGLGTALGPVLVRRWLGERREQLQKNIGWSFLLAGIFYVGFGSAPYFVLALLALMTAHACGSVIWVNSTLLLQRTTEDDFRGRVFASETALQTFVLTFATYTTGELQDRFGFSPRAVAIIIGLCLLPACLLWFGSQTWWDKSSRAAGK